MKYYCSTRKKTLADWPEQTHFHICISVGERVFIWGYHLYQAAQKKSVLYAHNHLWAGERSLSCRSEHHWPIVSISELMYAEVGRWHFPASGLGCGSDVCMKKSQQLEMMLISGCRLAFVMPGLVGFCKTVVQRLALLPPVHGLHVLCMPG